MTEWTEQIGDGIFSLQLKTDDLHLFGNVERAYQAVRNGDEIEIVRHARWELDESRCSCTACGARYSSSYSLHKRCPKCGAIMNR